MTRICHISSAHVGLDIRIYRKQCVTLARAGYDVHLVISATESECSETEIAGITLHRLPPPPKSRLLRIFSRIVVCCISAARIRASVYHLHDVELLPVGLILRAMGRLVIYDVHEDVPEDILTKTWIPFFLRAPLGKLVGLFEAIAARYFLQIVTATPAIAKRFLEYNGNTECINNFPLIEELVAEDVNWADKKPHLAYMGVICRIRGIREVVQALGVVRCPYIRLRLAGSCDEDNLESELVQLSGWSRVDQLGWRSRAELRDELRDAMCGIVTFLPFSNHVNSQPNKMFEYMSAGLPVIASNFPLWREVLEGNQCGICVDPEDVRAIANAIDFILDFPAEAERMGKNAQEAVRIKYNWDVEGQRLVKFYHYLENK